MRRRLRCKICPLLLMLMLLPMVLVGCGGSNGGGSEEGNIDVNLSALSATMLFAEITRITNNPEDYLGQVIKIHGEYFNFYDGERNQYIHFVLVLDEAGCCNEGFQFRVSEEFGSPEDLFEIQEEIEIIGVFSSCEGDEWGRYYLAVEELNIL